MKISLQAVKLKPIFLHMSMKLSARIVYTSVSIELSLRKQDLNYLPEKNQATFSYDVNIFCRFHI